MAKCAACGKFLATVGAATCSICPLIFHKACVAISETATVSKQWSCPECKKKVRKGDNSATPVKSIYGTDTQLDISSPPSGEEDENEVRAMRREIAEYMVDLRKEMIEIRISISSFGQRLDTIERRLDVLEQSKTTGDTKGTAELESTIEQLKIQLNERDQEALLTDLDIGCLPEEKGENPYHIVTVLGAKLGVKIEDRDIVFAERIGGSSARNISSVSESAARPRRLVVRLARRNLRDDLLQAARVRRNLNACDIGITSTSQTSRRIYINERLTRSNRYLFYKVREECRKRNWRYAWTKRGRVFARQGDGKQAFVFRSVNDLVRVFELGNV